MSSERITGGGGSGGSAAAAAALMPISSIGQMTRTTPAQPTGRQSNPMSYSRSLPQPPQTMLSTLSNHGGRLLPTTMDSFVMDAAGMAELIYGDEGDESIPPYFGFTEEHRINAGINSQNLTTGHASSLPEAWGYPQ